MSRKNRRSKDQPPKEDKSIHVPQKSKVDLNLQIRQLPWTDKQKELIQLLQNKNTEMVIIKGPAGSAKTAIAVYCALEALNSKKIGEIVYVRSIVESTSHGMGYLPGELEEKLTPYLTPLFDKMEEFLQPSQAQYLVNAEKIRGTPIGFMRGMSINCAHIIADECQNFTAKELLTLMTRVGKHTKLIMTGDIRQSDIKDSGFLNVYSAFDNDEARNHGIYTFKFGLEDIMRSEVVKYIVKKFEDIQGLSPQNSDWTPKKP
jgi:phosphate starvation-inducible PhoH-like protein